jgi:integrase/recombinase XerD
VLSSSNVIAEWSSDDIADVLIELTKAGKSPRSIARCLSALRQFYKFLREQKLRDDNPVATIKHPKLDVLYLKIYLKRCRSTDSMHQISNGVGFRDRAMFEVLYACGLRVSELLNLRLELINLKQGYLRITGKGNKERLVPLGQYACEWVEKY